MKATGKDIVEATILMVEQLVDKMECASKEEVDGLYGAILITLALEIQHKFGADSALDALVHALGQVVPQSSQYKAAEQLRNAQKGQFDA